MSGIDTSAHVGANGLQVGPEMLEGEPFEDAGMWLTPEDNMAKHHHPCTPIETPRSESELSFDFHYPTDSDEEEDPAVDLTKVAFGVIYVPTKHFKARKPLKTPVWQQMCRPSPLPKRLPKQHPSYEDEEKRILREMAATKRIEIEQAVVERKKYDRSRENSHEWVQGQVWMEREMELRWELISSTYRLSEKSISKRTKRENEFSLELVREAIVELKTLLKMKPTHPNGRMLIIRCIGRLPHKERVAMYGPSYTVDWIYRANPKTSWKTPFLNHRVPRTKLYDPQYRVLASHEAPPMAWLHYMDIKVDEGISDARERGSKAAAKIQRLYLKRYRFRGKNATEIQRLYRAHCIRMAVKRKWKREGSAQSIIAARTRGVQWRDKLRQMKISIVVLQCMARRRRAMWALYDLKLDKEHGEAAIQIQKMMRGWWRRRCWKLAKLRIRVLRFVVRIGVFMNRCLRRRSASIRIQTCWRCFVPCRNYRIYRETKAAKKIQTITRKVKARKEYRNYLRSILRLQCNLRRKRAQKVVAETIVERTIEEEVRVDDEQEFVEYVEENCIDSVLEFLKTREGKMMVSTVANRLSSRDKQYRRKRFWMWFKGQGQAKVLKAKFAVWFSHYDVLGVGRLGFDSLRAFMKDELCVPVDDEEFTNLAIMLDDSIPQGGTRGVGALLKRKKTVSSAFYATFNTIYLWFAQLTGWPVEEKTKIKKKARSSKPKRAKSSVSLKYVSEKEHAASQKKLKRKKALKRITTSKYKGIATKTILAQVRRHARASAMERFREVHRPSGVCSHCKRAFAFHSDLNDHRDGKISRSTGIAKIIMDAHLAADAENDIVRRWKLSCVDRSNFDAAYLDLSYGRKTIKSILGGSKPLYKPSFAANSRLKNIFRSKAGKITSNLLSDATGTKGLHRTVDSGEKESVSAADPADILPLGGVNFVTATNKYVVTAEVAKGVKATASTEDVVTEEDTDLDEEEAEVSEDGFL